MPNGDADHMSTGEPFPNADSGFPMRSAFAFGPRDPETGLYPEPDPRQGSHIETGLRYTPPDPDLAVVMVGILRELAEINLSLRALLQFQAILAAEMPQARPLTPKQAVTRAAQDIARWRESREAGDDAR